MHNNAINLQHHAAATGTTDISTVAHLLCVLHHRQRQREREKEKESENTVQTADNETKIKPTKATVLCQ